MELRKVLNIRSDLFNFSYDYPDEHKFEFEKGFIRYNFFNEIAYRTIEEFMFRLETEVYLRAPIYAKMFEAEKQKFDIYSNFGVTKKMFNTGYNINNKQNKYKNLGESDDDIRRVYSSGREQNENRDETGNIKTTLDGKRIDIGRSVYDKNHTNKYYDTPQSQLKQDEDTYLTHLTKDSDEDKETRGNFGKDDQTNQTDRKDVYKGQQNEKTQGNSNDKEKRSTYSEGRNASVNSERDRRRVYSVKTGYEGKSPSELLMEYRKTCININLLFIQNLDNLFMRFY